LLLLQFALQMFDDWLMMHFAPFLNILCIGNTTNFVGKRYIYIYITPSGKINYDLSRNKCVLYMCQGILSGVELHRHFPSPNKMFVLETQTCKIGSL
jgi:hypothetical protein